MRLSQSIMGMPITVEVVSDDGTKKTKVSIESVFTYFNQVDARFSTYKTESEISKFNRNELAFEDLSDDMRTVLALCEETKTDTLGYFDSATTEGIDPSGLVKGWAIHTAADILRNQGYSDFFIEAGGDIEVSGRNALGLPWLVGIRNPFDKEKIIKIVHLTDHGIATSGTYERGEHIYNPIMGDKAGKEIASITIIGPNVYQADRFATAAFAMGKDGIVFIERSEGLEGYMVDRNGIATMTSNFKKYVNE